MIGMGEDIAEGIGVGEGMVGAGIVGEVGLGLGDAHISQ